MSKFEQCPECGKKGWYTVYGYDPNPEKGPMKRCKYCYHTIRILAQNKTMEYNTISEAAEQLGLRPDQVNSLCTAGIFGRKVSNVWLITDQEIDYHKRGERLPEDQQPNFYDAAAAIKDLGISRSRFYRMVATEEIDVSRFGNRGGRPNIFMTEDQMEAARSLVKGSNGSATRIVEADQYINERDGRFYVKGTKDSFGRSRHYKTRTSARAKARQVHGI